MAPKRKLNGTEVNRRIGKANRDRVRQWLRDHLGGTRKECAEALGMNVSVVGRHVAEIRREWER